MLYLYLQAHFMTDYLVDWACIQLQANNYNSTLRVRITTYYINNKVGGASKQSTIRGYRWGEHVVRISVPRTQYHARATMK